MKWPGGKKGMGMLKEQKDTFFHKIGSQGKSGVKWGIETSMRAR